MKTRGDELGVTYWRRAVCRKVRESAGAQRPQIGKRAKIRGESVGEKKNEHEQTAKKKKTKKMTTSSMTKQNFSFHDHVGAVVQLYLESVWRDALGDPCRTCGLERVAEGDGDQGEDGDDVDGWEEYNEQRDQR